MSPGEAFEVGWREAAAMLEQYPMKLTGAGYADVLRGVQRRRLHEQKERRARAAKPVDE